MKRNESDIIWERFLKFLMFGVATFCTGGLFFGAYVIYHLVMLDRELENNKEIDVPLTERQIVININKPENLTEEDKKYFYDHPNAYKSFIKGHNNDKPYFNTCNEDVTKNVKYTTKNPRFKYGGYFDCWWNKPYWDSVKQQRSFQRRRDITKLERKINVDKWLIEEYIKEVDSRLEDDFDEQLDFYRSMVDDCKKTYESTKKKLDVARNEYEYKTFSNYEEEIKCQEETN